LCSEVYKSDRKPKDTNQTSTLCWTEPYLAMKVYLAPTVGAIILVLFIKFHLATAAPIHTPSGSSSSNAPAGSDIGTVVQNSISEYQDLQVMSVPPISPHVSANQKGKEREVLWKDQIEMPPDFIPAGTSLKLRIPSNEEGLDSIVNIVGLMRTAIAGPTWKATADTGASLSTWLANLKYRLKKMPTVIKIPRGSSISYEYMEGLKDEDLRRRKEEIKEIVEKHNEGKWFKPDEKIKEEIYRYIKHPLKKPVKEQRLEIHMPKHFIPEGTDLKLWIPDSNEGRDSVIQIIELMRTAVQVGGYPGGIYTGHGLTNWIDGLKKRNVLGGKTIPNGPKSPFLDRLTGDALIKRKKEIEKAVQGHNNGHWFVPDEIMAQDIKTQLSAVPLGLPMTRKRPAESHAHDTGRQRQHIHHPNIDDVHTLTGQGTHDRPSMITTLPPAFPHTTLYQEHPSGNSNDVQIGTHVTSHLIDHTVLPALRQEGHSSGIPWDHGHVGMDMGLVHTISSLNEPQIHSHGTLDPHGMPTLDMGASIPITNYWHNIDGQGYDGALDYLAHTTYNDQLMHSGLGSYDSPSHIANIPVIHHPEPHMTGQFMPIYQDHHSGHADATYDNWLMHSGIHEPSDMTNTLSIHQPVQPHDTIGQFIPMSQDHSSHKEGQDHRKDNSQG
ncbi:hypothetical protein H0H93_009623, partial [Arthromyces matolae]